MNRTNYLKNFLCAVTAMILFLPASGYAQKSVRFGIKGGYDVLDRRIDTDILKSSNRTGFQIGLTLDVPIAGGFGVNLSTLYTQRNYNADSLSIGTVVVDKIDKLYALDVPLNLTYTLPIGSFGVVFSAGPYVSCRLDGGDIHSRQIVDTYKERTFTAGANFGVGVDIGRHFNVGLTYYSVLTDNYKEIDPEFEDVFRKRPDRMSLNATLYF